MHDSDLGCWFTQFVLTLLMAGEIVQQVGHSDKLETSAGNHRNSIFIMTILLLIMFVTVHMCVSVRRMCDNSGLATRSVECGYYWCLF